MKNGGSFYYTHKHFTPNTFQSYSRSVQGTTPVHSRLYPSLLLVETGGEKGTLGKGHLRDT